MAGVTAPAATAGAHPLLLAASRLTRFTPSADGITNGTAWARPHPARPPPHGVRIVRAAPAAAPAATAPAAANADTAVADAAAAISTAAATRAPAAALTVPAAAAAAAADPDRHDGWDVYHVPPAVAAATPGLPAGWLVALDGAETNGWAVALDVYGGGSGHPPVGGGWPPPGPDVGVLFPARSRVAATAVVDGVGVGVWHLLGSSGGVGGGEDGGEGGGGAPRTPPTRLTARPWVVTRAAVVVETAAVAAGALSTYG